MDYLPGQYFSSVDMNYIKRQSEGFGVLAGLEVSGSGASLAVIVNTGTAVIGLGTNSTYSNMTVSETLSLNSNDYNPMKALVFMNSAGDLSASYGTASEAIPEGNIGRYTKFPFPPSLPSDSTLLAELWIPAGSTLGSQLTIYNVDKIGGCFWVVE